MTAYSKAEKRANKRGRPRLAANSRDPSGRPSQRLASREHANTDVVKAQRMKRFGIAEMDAADPQWEDVLSLLFKDRWINKVQHQAGKLYANEMGKFYHLDNIPSPSPKAQDYLRGSPGYDGEESSEQHTATSRANLKARLARQELLRCGDISTARRVLMIVDMATILNRDDVFMRRCETISRYGGVSITWHPLPGMQFLVMGLNKLAKFYKLL